MSDVAVAAKAVPVALTDVQFLELYDTLADASALGQNHLQGKENLQHRDVRDVARSATYFVVDWVSGRIENFNQIKETLADIKLHQERAQKKGDTFLLSVANDAERLIREVDRRFRAWEPPPPLFVDLINESTLTHPLVLSRAQKPKRPPVAKPGAYPSPDSLFRHRP